MFDLVLAFHIIICVVLVGLILLQRNEGGGLGMGGPSGGMFAARGQGNILTRLTAYCAVAFVATSIGLALIANNTNVPLVIEQLPQPQAAPPASPASNVPLN